MSFDAYTNSGQGENKFQPLPILANRDPVNGIDFSNPGGGPYQIDQKWFNSNNANYWRYIGHGTWVKDSSATGNVLDFLPDSGTTPVVPDGVGNVGLNGVGGGGVTTVGGTNQVFFEMQSPFSLTPFEFTQQVGIQTPASTNPVAPLTMANNIAGSYGPTISNLSTADATSSGIAFFNSANSLQMGMASTGFVSNPVLQGNAFFQSTTGMVWSCVDPAQVMNWYIGGMQALNLTIGVEGPMLQIFNGYLQLANQSKVNSFQNKSLTVANGATVNLVVIGSGEQWQFFASTASTTPDTTYRAAATILSFDNGSNTVDNYASSKITFATAGNQVTVSNAGAASVNLMISGIRIL